MIARRLIAAAAAIVTVLVVQATVVSAVVAPLAVSLPAVLVAAVGAEMGVSAGMSVGFSAGLLADLSSRHPAGVLALAWLLLGLGCGLLAEPRRRALRSIVIVTFAAGLCGAFTFAALELLDAPGGSLRAGLALSLPSALGDAVLALLVVPSVRVVVRAVRVRPPVAASRAAQPVGIVGRMAVDG